MKFSYLSVERASSKSSRGAGPTSSKFRPPEGGEIETSPLPSAVIASLPSGGDKRDTETERNLFPPKSLSITNGELVTDTGGPFSVKIAELLASKFSPSKNTLGWLSLMDTTDIAICALAVKAPSETSTTHSISLSTGSGLVFRYRTLSKTDSNELPLRGP